MSTMALQICKGRWRLDTKMCKLIEELACNLYHKRQWFIAFPHRGFIWEGILNFWKQWKVKQKGRGGFKETFYKLDKGN